MKKQYKSSVIKNHEITNKKNVDGVPIKGSIASEVIFRFRARNEKKKALWEYPVANDD